MPGETRATAAPDAAGGPTRGWPTGRHRTAAGPHTGLAPAEERGGLELDDAVVEKIAATALGEVDEIGAAARRVLDVGGGDPDRRPRVDVAVHGPVVDLDVRATVSYPGLDRGRRRPRPRPRRRAGRHPDPAAGPPGRPHGRGTGPGHRTEGT